MEASCLCGAVEIRAEPRERRLWACHCSLCTGWTGATQFGFNAAPERVEVKGPVRLYRSSGFSERAWCERCGTALWLRSDGEDYEFTAGLFPESRDWPLNNENYIDRAHLAMRLAGDHKRLTAAEYESRFPHVPGDER